FLLGCAAPSGRSASAVDSQPDAETIARIDSALASAARYLVARQAADGRWLSGHYGAFRDDAALTPHVLSALAFMPQGGAAADAAFRRGVQALGKLVTADGRIDAGPFGLGFPAYTAAEASWVFVLKE